MSHSSTAQPDTELPQHVQDWLNHPEDRATLEAPPVAPVEDTDADRRADPMRLTTYAELRSADLNDEVEWLVPSLLPKVGCAFVAAPPKHLKSWLLLDLLMAVTGGGEFLGLGIEADKDATVLYLAGEGRAGALRWRLNRLLNGREIHPGDVGDRIHLSICPNIMLDEDPRLGALRAALDNIEPTPSLVVLDPLTRLHGADENSRNEVEPMLTALRRLSEDYQTLLILAHHSRKSSGQGGHDPLRGSSSFRGWHDALIYLEPNSSDEAIRVLRAELRDAEPFGPIHVKLSVSDLSESAEIKITEAPEQQDKAQERNKKVIEFLLARGPQSGRAIRDHIHCSGDTLKSVMSNLIGATIDGVRVEAIADDRGSTQYQAVRLGEQEAINETW